MDSRGDLSDFFGSSPDDDGFPDGSHVEFKYLHIRVRRAAAAPRPEQSVPTLIGTPAAPPLLGYDKGSRFTPREWRIAIAVGAVVIAIVLALIGAYQFFKTHDANHGGPSRRGEGDTPRLWIELSPPQR